MKIHPPFVTLIELTKRQQWQVVSRMTTMWGYSREVVVASEELPDYPSARREFEKIKEYRRRTLP